jgi:protein involved in polysaccharide export with SLBB domain
MIQLSKTAAALSVVLCGALAVIAGAQEPDEDQPRPRPRPRPQASARPAPEEKAAESMPPPSAVSPGAQGAFALPPGMSEEFRRSLREFPLSSSTHDNRMIDEPPADEAPSSPGTNRAAPPLPSRSAPAKTQQRPEYVVEPPDLIIVEVLEALPGRPISGERLVRPDGRITLGFYGEIPVAGLTLSQIKERIVLHLRKFISDGLLGLLEIDYETGEIKRDPNGRAIVKDPKDTDRVFVDVTAYNSQHCYVLGDVTIPGSLPYTGGDTVLDLIQYAGGLLPSADKARIRLIRSFPKGSPARVLPINYEEITMGTDASTNDAILPNDRLVIPSSRSSRPGGDADLGATRGEPAEQGAGTVMAPRPRPGTHIQGSTYFNRRASLPPENPNAALEKRIEELENKLDRLIEVMGQNQRNSAAEPQERPAAVPADRNPFEADTDRVEPTEPAPEGRMSTVPRRAGARALRPRRVRPERPRSSVAPAPRRQEAEGAPERPARPPSIPEQRSPFDMTPPPPE